MRRLRSGDRALDSFQDAVEDALRPVESSPLYGCKLVTGVELDSGGTLVAHGQPRGARWFLVSPTADARVWEGPSPSSRHLALTASAPLSCSLLTFQGPLE